MHNNVLKDGGGGDREGYIICSTNAKTRNSVPNLPETGLNASAVNHQWDVAGQRGRNTNR